MAEDTRGVSLRFIEQFNDHGFASRAMEMDLALALLSRTGPITGDTRTFSQQLADALEYVRTHREQFPGSAR